ncbi:helix-turn-helix domain-containing protein [Streptomyces sp. NBC_01387]|uniref:helix-turn-helix domain-containing protein n=1 Tax=unclassified Streptomyces TaxID=2593676 RepID=UPI00225484DC|nr:MULTISPECIES: helix-turn-helix transcriptional regulator [unclassified Streptomyces]MCX4550506.1 helix-turn-helix domain-containing protein [Streptomyces sp. NBC_01500]WSC21955.1 helix-turn-helix domain-containing protein [Streptomyces sp. NBC_01766]WSV55910.1 helix-turn-helix domain-containing protein [Streptomyces sp. NBC_01014]
MEHAMDDESAAVLRAVGRQIKLWRERAGLTQSELGAAIGYGEEQVSSVERGRRVPKPEFLDAADRVLGAGGIISAMKKDVADARLPKKVRDLAKLEAGAVELGAYGNHNLQGLLQTEEYTRALFQMRRPAYSEDEIDRQVEARMGRRIIFERRPSPTLTFVQEEATLRRPLGGRPVLRRQLEHLLEVGQLRNVEIQVMPTEREDHAGMGGEIQVLKLEDGSAVGYTEASLSSYLISDPKEIQILELRYGIIRSQALTPRESLAFIEKLLGET